MKKYISLLVVSFICGMSWAQTNTIKRQIVKNKLIFVNPDSGKKISQEEFELEPDSLRHIGRYVRFDTVANAENEAYQVQYSIVEGKIPYSLKDDSDYGGTLITFNYNFFYPKFEPIPVYKNGKYGYINTKGKLIIPYIYDKADNFFQEKDGNVYAIVNINGKYGIIDVNGKTVVDFIYNQFIYFQNEKEGKQTKSGIQYTEKLVLDKLGKLVPNKIYLVEDENYVYNFVFENGKFIQKK